MSVKTWAFLSDTLESQYAKGVVWDAGSYHVFGEHIKKGRAGFVASLLPFQALSFANGDIAAKVALEGTLEHGPFAITSDELEVISLCDATDIMIEVTTHLMDRLINDWRDRKKISDNDVVNLEIAKNAWVSYTHGEIEEVVLDRVRRLMSSMCGQNVIFYAMTQILSRYVSLACLRTGLWCVRLKGPNPATNNADILTYGVDTHTQKQEWKFINSYFEDMLRIEMDRKPIGDQPKKDTTRREVTQLNFKKPQIIVPS